MTSLSHPALRLPAPLPGLALAVGLASLALLLARWPVLAAWHVAPLTLAIVLGMLLGNLGGRHLPAITAPGLAIAQRQLLRAGVVLYGFRLQAQDLGAIGINALIVAVLIVLTTLALGAWIGRRWLGLDRETALLTAAGSAICGAAAVLAFERTLRADPGKVAMAVATVVLFGTLTLAVYPLLYDWLALSPAAFGVYTGATVHEVAQVVAIGHALAPDTADAAVVVKLARVLMLVPVLLLIARLDRSANDGRSAPIPWFVLGFAAVVLLNSLLPVPPALTEAATLASTLLLATAMAALGINTRASMLRRLGLRPLLLAALLAAWLMIAGYLLVRVLL